MSQGMTTRNGGIGKNQASSSSSTRITWTSEHIDALLDTIVEFIDNGEVFTDKNFKSQDWNKILQNFNDRTSLGYDKDKLQNCFSELKKKYVQYQGIKDNS